MTADLPAPDNQPSGITLPMFIGIVLVVVGAAMAAVWFAFPAPDNLHRLVSPSGSRVIELGELCAQSCNRVAILDVTQPDGTHIRTGCPLDRPEPTPLFAEIKATWTAIEDSIDIAYIAATGPTGTITIPLAACTQTE